MKLTVRDKKIILILGGFILLLLVYQFAYKPMAREVEALQTEIAAVKADIQELDALIASEDTYRDGISTMNADITGTMILGYSAGIKMQDLTAYAVTLQQSSGSSIFSVSMGSAQTLLTITGAGDLAGKTIVGEVVPMTFAFSTTYNGLKALINRVFLEDERRTISSISLSYDTASEKVSGTATLNLYVLEGAGVAYEDPDLGTISSGNDNIFDPE